MYKSYAMKLKYLFPFAFLTAFSIDAFADKVVMDFEDDKTTGSGWDMTESIVDNPVKCGNTSSKCELVEPDEAWGMTGVWIEYNRGTEFIIADIFMNKDGDITMRDNMQNTDETNNNVVVSIKGGVWNRVAFDTRSFESISDNQMVYFGRTSSPFYIDNIKVTSTMPTEYDCTKEEKKTDVDYTFGRVKIGGGGFVAGIVAEGSTMIARTDVGGAYIRNHADCSWTPITDFISEDDKGLYSIEAVAIDPSNHKNIYLLGGCQYFSGTKTAMMISKDGGKNFDIVPVTDLIRVHGNGQGRNCGERIAVDPNNSDIVYAGGRAGSPLIMSVDGGKKWSKVESFPSETYGTTVNWPSWESTKVATTADENGTTCVVFDKSSVKNGKTQRIFVGISRTGADNIYVSEDAGSTWSALKGTNNGFVPCRMKMNKRGELIICCADKCVGGSKGKMYKYDIAGDKITDITPSNAPALGGFDIAPSDPDKMVVSTNNTWIPQKWDGGLSANGDIVWTTTDGGKTWNSLQNKMTLYNSGVTWVKGYALHWCGSICIDPTDENKASFTSGNGIFTCDQIWCPEPKFYFDVNGLEETVPLDIISIPGRNTLSVIGDYTGFIHNDIHEFPAIHDPAPGTTGGICYYPQNPDVMMRVANTGFYITTAGESGWKQVSKTSAQYNNPYCGECGPMASNEGKCAITKVNGNYRFFVIPIPDPDGNGSGSGIFYSDDEGKTWTLIEGTKKAIRIVTDPMNDSYLYASGMGVIMVSDDYGKTFKDVAIQNTFGWQSAYTRLCVVPGHEGLIYAPCAGNGIMVSTDHGSTFKKLSGIESCEAVGCGKGKKDGEYALYIYGSAGDGNGFFRSLDEGKTWQLLSDSKHQFGGPGNGQFLEGDQNVFGRFYMSSIGLGIIYGEETATAIPHTWECTSVVSDKCDASDVDDVEAEKSMVVYPNPSNSEFTFTVGGEYELISALGQTIEAGRAEVGQTFGANLPSGIYFLKMNGEAYKVVKK